jgi:hypothetical protein
MSEYRRRSLFFFKLKCLSFTIKLLNISLSICFMKICGLHCQNCKPRSQTRWSVTRIEPTMLITSPTFITRPHHPILGTYVKPCSPFNIQIIDGLESDMDFWLMKKSYIGQVTAESYITSSKIYIGRLNLSLIAILCLKIHFIQCF